MRTFVLVFAFAVGAFACAAASSVAPADLLARPSTYDGQSVTVTGAVSGLRSHVSHKGNAYVTFDLCASSVCVRVFEWGSPDLADGQSLTVHGTFSVEKHVGRYTFHNEIDVSGDSP